ncbi:MAG: hypothetical protein WAN65_12735, partial [Candidatus Sulfotelmatobacter sp.]
SEEPPIAEKPSQVPGEHGELDLENEAKLAQQHSAPAQKQLSAPLEQFGLPEAKAIEAGPKPTEQLTGAPERPALPRGPIQQPSTPSEQRGNLQAQIKSVTQELLQAPDENAKQAAITKGAALVKQLNDLGPEPPPEPKPAEPPKELDGKTQAKLARLKTDLKTAEDSAIKGRGWTNRNAARNRATLIEGQIKDIETEYGIRKPAGPTPNEIAIQKEEAARKGDRDIMVRQEIPKGSSTSGLPLPEMNPEEKADIERRVGRPLTNDEAHLARVRDTVAKAAEAGPSSETEDAREAHRETLARPVDTDRGEKAPADLAKESGLVYKGPTVKNEPTSPQQFEHPDHPGVTMAIAAKDMPAMTAETLKQRMDAKLGEGAIVPKVETESGRAARILKAAKEQNFTPEQLKAMEPRTGGPRDYYKALTPEEKPAVDEMIETYKNGGWHGQHSIDDYYRFNRPNWKGLPIEERIARVYKINEPAIRSEVEARAGEFKDLAEQFRSSDPEMARTLDDLVEGKIPHFFTVGELRNMIDRRLEDGAEKTELGQAFNDYEREPGEDRELDQAQAGEGAPPVEQPERGAKEAGGEETKLGDRPDADGLLGKGSRLSAGIDPTMVRDLYRSLNKTWDDVAEHVIQNVTKTGRTHADVEKVDPSLASRIRDYDNAPLYFKTKAEDLVKSIVGPLDRSQERLFSLLADADARANLEKNHPDEYAKAVKDPEIQKAIERYRPIEQELTKARTAIGGEILDRDYLRRVYTEHTSGIGKRTSATERPTPAGFDKVITPQRADKYSRAASAEYHYKNGLHEFGPAFATKYVGTMTKLAEHRAAAEFLSHSTKLEPGDEQPVTINYNGKTFYRPDVAQMIREAKPGPESEAIARDLGVEQLPKPKDAPKYAIYDPKAGKPGAGPLDRYAGPQEVIDALHGLHEQPLDKQGIISRFIREQVVGGGFGIPHFMNEVRQISATFAGASGNPVNWVRAIKVLADDGLKERALSRTNDPTFDALLKHGGISPMGIESYKSYVGGNFNPANWFRAFGKVGHHYHFDAGGFDQRGRLFIADRIKAAEPQLSDERVAQLVNEQLGQYNRTTWTDFQKRVGPYMMFPGWDFSSINWALRHPIKTAVAPAILTFLANQAIHSLKGNKDRDEFDPFSIHVGNHSFGAPFIHQPLSKHLFEPVGRAVEEMFKGGDTRQVVTAGARAVPQAIAAPLTMARPDLALPAELAVNKSRFGKDIVEKGDWTRQGTILPNKGLEDEAKHVASVLFPAAQRVTEGGEDWFEALLGNFGIQRQKEKPRRPEIPTRIQDVYNVEDEIRDIKAQADTIARDHELTQDEKDEALSDLRKQYKEALQRYAKQQH